VQGLEMNRTVLSEKLRSKVHCGEQGRDGRTTTTYSKEIALDVMDITYHALLNTVMEPWVLQMCGIS